MSEREERERRLPNGRVVSRDEFLHRQVQDALRVLETEGTIEERELNGNFFHVPRTTRKRR